MALYCQRNESRNKKPKSKDADLRSHNQSNAAEAARNGNKIYHPTI